MQQDPAIVLAQLPPSIWSWALLEALLLPLLLGGLVIGVYFFSLRHGMRFTRKQADYLDHQRTVNERALEQNKTFEDMIARQHAETNMRADRALAQSEEAVRLHAAALEELATMNAKLERLVGALDGKKT